MTVESQKSSRSRIVFGIVQIAIALGIYFWAREHSPHMGFLEALSKMNSYVLREPAYSIVLIVAAIIGLLGIIMIARGLQAAKA